VDRLRTPNPSSLPARTAAGGMLAALLLLAGCGTPAESASPASPTSAPTASPDDASPSAAAEPGRPYDAADVLTAMQESRRPGGVAEELQTEGVAAQVAQQLWTWDGTPWSEVAMGGSCGPDACTLEVTGSTDGGAGADTYTFAIAPATGDVQLAAADLHGYPADIEAQLDTIAREGVDASELEGLTLLGARWLPPPDTGQYWLSYRSGGEEGSPGMDVLVDLAGGTVLDRKGVVSIS